MDLLFLKYIKDTWDNQKTWELLQNKKNRKNFEKKMKMALPKYDPDGNKIINVTFHYDEDGKIDLETGNYSSINYFQIFVNLKTRANSIVNEFVYFPKTGRLCNLSKSYDIFEYCGYREENHDDVSL